jgi:methyl-accepting chemotaxis protein
MLANALASLRSSARTTTFRVAMAFAGLFAGFAVLLLGFLYAATVGRLGIEADQAARREMSDLSVIWSTQGVAGLNMEVIQRAARADESLYVLVRPDGSVLSGNIDGAPLDLSQVKRPEQGSQLDPQTAIANAFSYERPNFENGALQKRRARGLFLAGPDGFGLFVARDLGPGVEAADQVAKVIWMGGAGVLAFALVGGFLSARQAASRVDELSRTTRAVMAGDLGQRAAVRTLRAGEGDEFDELTLELNAMLERIERLIGAARTTGDSIAHDLRSPLTRLRARLETASASAISENDLRDAIDDSLNQLDSVVATFNGGGWTIGATRCQWAFGTNC